MAASIAAVYPHMNHIGGDGFWLIRERSGRVRAIMGAGRAGAKATLQLYRDARLRRNSVARAARRAHGAGRGGDLDARGRGGESQSREAPARRAAIGRHQTCARRLRGDAQPGAADGGKIAEMKDAAGFAGAFLNRRQGPGSGRAHQTNRFRRHPRPTRASRARRFLPWRCWPRDRRRPRTYRQPGDPRRSGEIRGQDCRAAQRPDPDRHALQYAAADAGSGLADHPGAV